VQRSLFDVGPARPGAYGPALAPRDPNADPRDVPRLTGQNAAILARLQRGPATSGELAALSLKYSGRVSDLRAAGYTIPAERLAGGEWRYTLTGEPPR
jgi:hypothetical protein